jgi:uncharacterized iron-regulated membrane protein
MTLTQLLRKLHLLLALTTAIVLLNICISGALLVFAKDIQRYMQPQFWTVTQGMHASTTRPLSALIEDIEAQTNQTVVLVMTGERRDEPWQLQLADGSFASVDPYLGRLLHRYRADDSFYGFLMAWHRWLLWTDARGDKPLQSLVATASLGLVINLLIGCLLWLRPKARWQRLKIRWGAKRKVLFNQLHTSLGIVTALPLLLIALTGIGFHWQKPVQALAQGLSLSRVETITPLPPRQYSGPRFGLDLALAQALRVFPGAELVRLHLPKDSLTPLKIRLRLAGESRGYSWVWLNPVTGEVLRQFDAHNASAATRLWNFKYELHVGDFLPPWLRGLWLLLALMPLLFLGTGCYLYLKKRAGRRAPEPAATDSRCHEPEILARR